MAGWIERLSKGWNRLDAELPQCAIQLFERQVDTLNQTTSRPAVLRGLDSSLQVVDDRQKLLEKLLVAKSDLIPLIALSQTLIIIEFGGKTKILIVE